MKKTLFIAVLSLSLILSGLVFYGRNQSTQAYGLAKPSFSVTKRTKKTATIKIKKNGSVSGYHVYVKTKKGKYSLTNFAIHTRTVKLTKLKANQTYYVKVRAYRTSGSSVRKSSFSKAKKIAPYKKKQSKKSSKQTAAKTTTKQTTATKAPAKSTVSTTAAPAGEDFVKSVFRLVNEEREKEGLYAYTLDETLCKAAGKRAGELVESFSHTRPNGENAVSVLKDYSYKFVAFGENIAAGQTSPAKVMDSWMHSEGHRRNIMSRDFTKIGIGFYQTSTGYVYYWTQLFAR